MQTIAAIAAKTSELKSVNFHTENSRLAVAATTSSVTSTVNTRSAAPPSATFIAADSFCMETVLSLDDLISVLRARYRKPNSVSAEHQVAGPGSARRTFAAPRQGSGQATPARRTTCAPYASACPCRTCGRFLIAAAMVASSPGWSAAESGVRCDVRQSRGSDGRGLVSPRAEGNAENPPAQRGRPSRSSLPRLLAAPPRVPGLPSGAMRGRRIRD